jgi:hypothetical protein
MLEDRLMRWVAIWVLVKVDTLAWPHGRLLLPRWRERLANWAFDTASRLRRKR